MEKANERSPPPYHEWMNQVEFMCTYLSQAVHPIYSACNVCVLVDPLSFRAPVIDNMRLLLLRWFMLRPVNAECPT